MLPFRHPDRLFHIFSLKGIREGEYLSQAKYDGHYAVIVKDADKIKVISRHDKPLPVSDVTGWKWYVTWIGMED